MLITEVLPNRLWWTDAPQESGLIRGLAVDVIYDLADADTRDPSEVQSAARYVKRPLVDGDEVVPEEVMGLRDDILADLATGAKVLIHCTFGKNRSGLLVALVLRSVEDLTGTDALERVRKLRVNAVNNDSFEAFLQGLPAPSEPIELRDLGPLRGESR